MIVLHQHNREGDYYETLCGKHLVEDIRLRPDDMLLATLAVEQEDMDRNFGDDAVICAVCSENVPVEEEEVISLEMV